MLPICPALHASRARLAGNTARSHGRIGVLGARVAPFGRQSLAPNTLNTSSSCCSSTAADLDAVIVLGGGLLPGGDLPEWVVRRLDISVALYAKQGERCPILCLGSGTPHKPCVLKGQHVYHESTACAEYLIQKGLPAASILKETSSYDTVGNAYFAATIHAIPAEWRRCAVVTSAFHMPRTRAIFRTCFDLATTGLRPKSHPMHLEFHSAPDTSIFSDAVLRAREKKEAQSLQEWRQNSSKLRSLRELHAWLFSEHLCYAVQRQDEFGARDLDPEVNRAIATY